MPLSPQQRAALEATAAERGVDPSALIAAAEEEMSERERPTSASEEATSGARPANAEPPKLFQYHLAFVRVREVRKVWLGLDEPFPGDEEIASEWAAKHGGGGGGSTPPPDAAA